MERNRIPLLTQFMKIICIDLPMQAYILQLTSVGDTKTPQLVVAESDDDAGLINGQQFFATDVLLHKAVNETEMQNALS